ncbi:formate dehydrogenase accessory sulfurtransferase FdhD, partial [Chloroflexota bacterium]
RVEALETKGFDKDLMFKRIISSGCGRGASFYSPADTESQKVDSSMKISPADIFSLVNKFQHGSEVYLATHGVHSAGLCDTRNILVFNEDIGRHNAVDKIFGKCLLEDIPTADRAVITTGRITSEILHKVAKRGIPILISISEPTNLGIRIADALNLTLVASVRGKKMNVYTGGWRLESDETYSSNLVKESV